MPPKTRRSGGGGGSAATSNQSTLSFKNKVTKSFASTPDTAAHKKAAALNEPAQEQAAEAIEIKRPSTPEPQPTEKETKVTIRSSPGKQKQETIADSESPTKRRKKSRKSGDYEFDSAGGYAEAEAQAKKTSDAQIKKYWKAEEDSRLAPRVHQATLPIHEKILRHFDLSSQYGPCIGITRLSRWKRAHSLSQNPPIEVLAVLLKEEAAEKDGSKGGRQCGKLAYIDELAGGRVVLVE